MYVGYMHKISLKLSSLPYVNHSSCEAIQVYTLQKCLLFQLKFGSNTDKPSKQFKRH